MPRPTLAVQHEQTSTHALIKIGFTIKFYILWIKRKQSHHSDFGLHFDAHCCHMCTAIKNHVLLFIVLLLLLSLSLFALVSYYVLFNCYSAIQVLSRKCAIKLGVSLSARGLSRHL